MSAFKNHRVVIASLFLPVTVNTRDLGDKLDLEDVFLDDLRGVDVKKPKAPAPPTARPKLPGPLPSIVDDLTGKRQKVASPINSPVIKDDSQNPFASLASTIIPTSSSIPVVDNLLKNVRRRLSGSSPATASPQARHLSRKTSRSNSLARSGSMMSGFDSPTSAFKFISNPHGNGGLYNAVHSVEDKFTAKLWVGVLGQLTDGFGPEQRRKVDSKLMERYDCQAVWVEDGDFSRCYDVFCHQVLWPCLHYAVPDAPKTKTFYESESFAQYKAVNQKFADAIVANYEEGDIIWVNDYHLMLVPQMVREKVPGAIIGFFLHVAFPSSEIFRCLAVRQELLRGMLASDLIGFQTANFVRHFRQTVSRLLSVETLPKGIQMENTFVDVAVFPMGIDVKTLTKKRKDPEVAEWVQVLKQRYKGMKLVVGRDKLDETQGVRQKLLAFEALLAKYPEFQEKAILIQVALQTSEENELHSNVSDIVSRINSKYSTLTYQPVVFLHTHDLTFNQYLALLTVADVYLVSSLREGMGLRTHEYVECQEGRARPLILSEFAGSHSFSGFRSCISINPYDTRQTMAAIYQGLTMGDEEASSRWKDLHSHVVTQTAQAFVSSFLNRCLRVHSEHQHSDPQSIPPFQVSLVLPRYRHSHTRLILLDYEDTLWLREAGAAEPPKETLQLLGELAKDPKNQVWLLSGLPISGAMDKVAAAMPEIGLCAENGCFVKPRGNSSWINMVANFNLTWKAPCMEILNYFLERTPGSFVEERQASIVFRFWPRGAAQIEGGNEQWARRQAAEAQNHIWDSLGERYGLRVIPGTTSFLVLPNNVSRSSAVGAILHPSGPAAAPSSPAYEVSTDQSSTPEIDFVLAIGGDEKLLGRLNDLDNAETVTTSGKESDAKWRLGNDAVVGALQEFVKAS